jgi:hypothetical protein
MPDQPAKNLGTGHCALLPAVMDVNACIFSAMTEGLPAIWNESPEPSAWVNQAGPGFRITGNVSVEIPPDSRQIQSPSKHLYSLEPTG